MQLRLGNVFRILPQENKNIVGRKIKNVKPNKKIVKSSYTLCFELVKTLDILLEKIFTWCDDCLNFFFSAYCHGRGKAVIGLRFALSVRFSIQCIRAILASLIRSVCNSQLIDSFIYIVNTV